jgi:hypothetical protein
MEVGLYEVFDLGSDAVVCLAAGSETEAEAEARRHEGIKAPKARLWRVLEVSDRSEIERRVERAVAEWGTAWDAAASARQQGGEATGQELGLDAAPGGAGSQNSAATGGQGVASGPERGLNGPLVGPGGMGEAVSHEGPSIYQIKRERKRTGRPVQGVKSPISPAIMDFYRPGEGFARDISLILDRTGCGVSGLARELGVDRDRVTEWRAGRSLPGDPVVFLHVLLWAARLRGGRWGWQR